VFPQFRQQYPQGTIQTEMLPKQEGKFIFRATISVNQVILSTATAADPDLETAEDRAIQRAFNFAGISQTNSSQTIVTLEPETLPNYQNHHQNEFYSPTEFPLLESPNNSPEDLSNEITQTKVEMERLGWTNDQGREYLMRTFGKKSRHQLSPSELRQFLLYLQSQPTRF
jgi:hypothetical protein